MSPCYKELSSLVSAPICEGRLKCALATLQEHIECGTLAPKALRAAVYIPALADFDALLLLSRDTLARAPCAVLSHKAQRAAAVQRGFAPALSAVPGKAQVLVSKRSRAMLRALPQGTSSTIDPVLLTCLCSQAVDPRDLSGNYHKTGTIWGGG